MSDVKSAQFKILNLIQAAVDLGLSVRQDVQTDGVVSEETIEILADFMDKHNNLSALLDLENAGGGGTYEN